MAIVMTGQPTTTNKKGQRYLKCKVPECEHRFIPGRNGNGLCDKHEDMLQSLIYFLVQTDVLDVALRLRQQKQARRQTRPGLVGPDGRPIARKGSG